MAIEQFDLDGYDLVLSTSHCAAKSVVVPGHTRHLCYCLTPMRYAWDQFDAYFGEERVGKVMNRCMRPVMAGMARWDRATAGRVHRYLAISQYVAQRIRLYYNRRSTIVYPPVETTFYQPDVNGGSNHTKGALVVSALVPYKRVELAIAAARLAGMPLTIVGDGPERAALEALGGGDVRFLGWCTNEQIRDLYRTSIATLLPGEEDFGIVPLESQACGRPVVALARGGALETVVDGVTGLLVEPGVEALADGLRRATESTWDSRAIREHAVRFSRERFVREIEAVIEDTMSAPAGQRW
jgi:glycosyltransferase involved in cell wall biosynthesis